MAGAVVGALAKFQTSHPTFAERQTGTDTAALAAVPLVASGRTHGAFVLFYRQAPGFNNPAVRELLDLGARLGETLELTRTTQSEGFAAWMRKPASRTLYSIRPAELQFGKPQVTG